MAMIKTCAKAVFLETTVVLGVKNEVQKLLQKMEYIQSLLKDAEKRKIKESSIDIWLSELKDVMYDADDIIDLCTIKANQLLLDDENSENDIFRICCNFSALSSFVHRVSLRREIAKRIEDLNVRLWQIDGNISKFNLRRSEMLEILQVTRVDRRQSSSLVDTLAVGEEVEVAANELVNLLITGEVVEERCRIFAVAGMGGIGKTTLAQKIFNHRDMNQNHFSLKVWIYVSQTYSETELLKQVIREANGKYGDATTTTELQRILRESVASCHSLFLVLDDVWRADVWFELLRVPLQTANTSVRVLVTTRDEEVAKAMNAAYRHDVMKLSRESSWDMLRKLLFSDGGERLSDELNELGIHIVERCGGLPLAIKAIAGVLSKRERSTEAWENILKSDIWSIKHLHDDHIAALQLSIEDLPSHLKQCFLYFSLYGEDKLLYRHDIARLWVAEGFITENINEGSLMEDVAEQYFNELLGRNLLLRDDPDSYGLLSPRGCFMDSFVRCKMHDLVRSLIIFLSKEETSYRDVNVKSSTTSTKLRRLSVEDIKEAEATEIFDLVAKQGALRTLLASRSDLLLNEQRLKWLSCLRVLDISSTPITELPHSIGLRVHLRYLNLSRTNITAIPESIKHLSYLQFLDISNCGNLTRLPNGITQLHNLRYLNLFDTDITFMPKGIEKLQQLNYLDGFPTDNTDTSSKLEDLNSLKQIRSLRINKLKEAQSEAIILKELPHLTELTLEFDTDDLDDRSEGQLAADDDLTDRSEGQLAAEADPTEEQLAAEADLTDRSEGQLATDDDFTDRSEGQLAAEADLTDRSEGQQAAEELFDKVIPPRCLKTLTIYKFFGRRFPNWLASSSENYVLKLTNLKLWGIECAQLPSLGQLSELKKVEIIFAFKVKKIRPEFFGDGVSSTTSIAFPKLDTLVIHKLYELEEWSFGAHIEDNVSPRLKILPCLRELVITSCPLLKQLLKGLKHIHIKSLKIEEANSLKFVEDLPSKVEELHFSSIQHLERVSCLPMLKRLSISNCTALSCLEKLHTLQELRFWDTDMEAFPDWLLMFLQHQSQQNEQDFLFELTCHKNVIQQCQKGGSYWELIQQIPKVTAHDLHKRSYLCYNKHLHVYDSKIIDESRIII